MKTIAQQINFNQFKMIYWGVLIFFNLLFFYTIFSFLSSTYNYYVVDYSLLSYKKLDQIIKNGDMLWEAFVYWLKNFVPFFIIKLILIKVLTGLFKKLPAKNFILEFEKMGELSHLLCRKLVYEFRHNQYLSFEDFMIISSRAQKEQMIYAQNLKDKDVEVFLKKYDQYYEVDNNTIKNNAVKNNNSQSL